MSFSTVLEDVWYWLQVTELGSMPVWRVISACFLLVLVYVIRRPVARLIIGVLGRLAERTQTDWDDQLLVALAPPLAAALQIVAFYAAFLLMALPRQPTDYHALASQGFTVAMIMVVAWGLLRSVGVITRLLANVGTKKKRSALDERLIPFVDRFLRVTLIVLASLMVLQEAGVKIAGILAGLGIGGLAIALAAKDVLANIFGTVAIMADHPFDIGDWIKTPQLEGTVEEIGMRSTRIRTFANSQVTVPNSSLANSPVENFSRMKKRRISFKLGLTYETTPAQMRETLERVKDLLTNHPGILQDLKLVYFSDFSDSAMELMVYCFSETTVWAEWLAVKESVNLQIVEALEEIGVEIAFPSRAIYMREDDPAERGENSERCQALLAEREA